MGEVFNIKLKTKLLKLGQMSIWTDLYTSRLISLGNKHYWWLWNMLLSQECFLIATLQSYPTHCNEIWWSIVTQSLLTIIIMGVGTGWGKGLAPLLFFCKVNITITKDISFCLSRFLVSLAPSLSICLRRHWNII